MAIRNWSALAVAMAGACAAAVTTNTWQGVETDAAGEYHVETLANWGLDEASGPDWNATFGYLDFRGLAPGATVGCTTNVIVDGMWFAPPTDAPDASWTLRRFTTGNWWVFNNGAELRVDGGRVDVTAVVRVPGAGYELRKTGAGRLNIGNAWGTDYNNQMRLVVEEGLVGLNHADALKNATLQPLSEEGVVPMQNGVRIGRVLDDRAAATDLDGKTVRIGRRGDSTLRTPWRNGTLASCAGSLLHLGAAPAADTALEVGDGDIVVNDLADVWRDCVGFWRFDLPGQPEFDSGFRFNQLMASGAPRIVADPVRGNVLELDGASSLKGSWGDKLYGEPTGSDPYTFACWIKVDPSVNAGRARMCVFKFGTLMENQCSFFGICEQGSGQVFHSHGGGQNKIISNVLAKDTWRHLAVVHDGASHLTYYVDGAVAETADWSNLTEPKGGLKLTPQAFQIGLAWSQFATNLRGRLDDVALFRRALTAAEVADLMDATKVTAARPYAEDQAFALTGTGRLHLLSDQTFTALDDGGAGLPVGGINLVQGATLTARTEADASFGGRVAGEGSFTKDGEGTLAVSGGLDYTGATRVAKGALSVRNPCSALVGNWSFDDAARPGADASANGTALAPNDAAKVAWVDDAQRGRVAKIASGGYLKGTLPANFPSGSSAYTAALWVKRSASCGNNGTFLVWGRNQVFTGQLQFRFFNSYQTLAFAHYGGDVDFTDVKLPYALAADTWYHLVATYDGVDTFRVYLDGKQVFERRNTTRLAVAAQGEIQVGSCWGNSERWFDGCVDDVRAWRRGLTADEVAALHRGEAVMDDAVLGCGVAPVAWYGFNDAANPGRDTSGNGYDLTVVGAPEIVDSPVNGGWLSLEKASVRSGLKYVDGDVTCPAKIPAGATSLTITVWLRLSDTANGTGNPVVFWGAGYPSAATILDTDGVDGENLRFVTLLTMGGGASHVAQPNSFVQGTPEQRLHFVACRYDEPANRMETYVDGQLLQSTVLWAKSASLRENFCIGCRDGNGNWLKGACIDELKIFDVALSADQIRMEMRADLARGGGRPLPRDGAVEVAEGAALELVGQSDARLASLTGAGRVRLVASALTLAGDASAGDLAGDGVVRLEPDAKLTLARGLDGFDAARVVALPSEDGKERRIFRTDLADGSCVLVNAVVPKGTLLLVR